MGDMQQTDLGPFIRRMKEDAAMLASLYQRPTAPTNAVVVPLDVIRNPVGLRETLCVRGWSELADLLVPPGTVDERADGYGPDPGYVTVSIPIALARTIRFDGDTLVWHNPDVPGHTVRMPGDGTAPTVERETPPDLSPPIKWTFADQIWRAGDPLTMSEYGMCGAPAYDMQVSGLSNPHCVLRAEHKGMHHGDDGSDWTA